MFMCGNDPPASHLVGQAEAEVAVEQRERGRQVHVGQGQSSAAARSLHERQKAPHAAVCAAAGQHIRLRKNSTVRHSNLGIARAVSWLQALD